MTFQQIYNDDDLEDMSNDEGDDEQEHLDEGISALMFKVNANPNVKVKTVTKAMICMSQSRSLYGFTTYF